jgi:Raf kinase inhibitor-like YbhB/YbcL family protein
MRNGAVLFAFLFSAGCGEKQMATTVAVHHPELSAPGHLTVSTNAVGTNGVLQTDFTASGARTQPKITWSGVPANTREVVVLIEDPDAPGDSPYVHLLVEGIPPGQTEYPGPNGVLAANSEGKDAYSPPNPPPGLPHHYHFEVLALGAHLGAKPISRDELFQQMASHVVASGEVVGAFGG